MLKEVYLCTSCGKTLDKGVFFGAGDGRGQKFRCQACYLQLVSDHQLIRDLTFGEQTAEANGEAALALIFRALRRLIEAQLPS